MSVIQLKLVRPPEAAAFLEGMASRLQPAELEVVTSAVDYVLPIYSNRRLPSGESVLTHVLETAAIVAELRLDHESLAAALLYPCHDLAPEAGKAVRDRFGPGVAGLAEGIVRMAEMGALSSRTAAIEKPQQQAAQLEALRKMLLAMVQDVRVVLIKLADHTRELRYLAGTDAPVDVRRESGNLTRDIFAPLANRLGIWRLKWELEDLALRMLEPATYRHIAQLLDEKRADRERYIDGVIAMLRGELARAQIVAEVHGRPKHIFSIYKKMETKGVDFESLYDVRAVRILVQDLRDCYAALGVVHNLWSPIPREFDDYIAKPKSNQYRSLHTAVIGPDGRGVEVQIRTYEMHQHSELGIAAHWRYKEGAPHDRSYDEKIAWLRQILEWKDEITDAGDLAEHFKSGLFEDTVYVLTPQGRVVDLPRGATPIDFAYHVHTELGHRCRGAKVDGMMVSLTTALQNGQRVEIVAAKRGGPSRDWLNPALGYLKSQGARTKVRQWFNRQHYEDALTQGRALLEKELQRHGAGGVSLEKLAAEQGYARPGDFFAAVGRGELGPKSIQDLLRIHTEPEAPAVRVPSIKPRRPRAGKGSVLIVGVDKLLTVTAKCCKPAPGDRIIGFVTRGRGVTVHRSDCANAKRLSPERRISAEWGEAAGAVFAVDVNIEALDRKGLLRDISDVFLRERINVTATATASADHVARMRFTLEVGHVDQLARALTLIGDIRGVLRAVRR
jgi:GTP pyrophosphokinase